MKNLIDQIVQDLHFSENPYFTALSNKKFLKDDFIETQIQFYFAVVFFNRPMTMLVSKLPETEARINILRNVWEEHGEGDPKFSHGSTFRDFLLALGDIKKEDIQGRNLWPELRIFNLSLLSVCVHDHFLVGAAAMGIIEYMFITASSLIAKGVIHNEFLSREGLIHYKLHEELDVRHSQDFFDVIEPYWQESEEKRYYIEQGLRMGATLFHNLYEQLYNNRNLRLSRKYKGPHTQVEGNLW